MQRRSLLCALPGLALVACGPKPLPPPPPAPPLVAAGDVIPADLDVVVRFDLGRVKATLGAIVVTTLAKEVLAAAGADETDQLVIDSLLAADVVYLGYRPSPLLAPLDRVLALQGRFEPLSRPPPGFTGAVDLGGDVRFFERKSPAPLARGAVSRVYTASTRVRAFVSEAEIDAVERVLSTGGAEKRLLPPEEGTMSLAARPALVGGFAGQGRLRALLDQARALRAVANLESDGVQLELELEMAEADAATQLAAAGQVALQRLGGLASRAELRAEGATVVLSGGLDRGALLPALGCLRRGSGSECPW